MIKPLLFSLLFTEPLSGWVRDDLTTQSLVQAQDFWIGAGVMEESERKSFFATPWNFTDDWEVMKQREAEITLDTPLANYPLPPDELCRSNSWMGRKFVAYLRNRIQEGREPAHEEALFLILWEAEWRLTVWTEIDDAHARFRDPLGKRLHLERLRTLIGPDHFDRCQFPDPLPRAAWNSEWDWNTNPYGN